MLFMCDEDVVVFMNVTWMIVLFDVCDMDG